MYQIKAHQVKVPKQKQLKSVLHLGVGIVALNILYLLYNYYIKSVNAL